MPTSTFSTTQATNIASIAGLLVIVLSHFHIAIGADEITAVLGAIVILGSNIINFINRAKKGDLVLGVMHK